MGFVAQDCAVTVNGVDLSSFVRSVAFTERVESYDITGVGDSSRVRASGIRDGEVTIEWLVDYSPAQLYRTIHALLSETTTVTVSPRSGPPSPGNPRHHVDVLVTEVPVLNAVYGVLSTMTTTWPFVSVPTVDEAYWVTTMTVGANHSVGLGFNAGGVTPYGSLADSTVSVPARLTSDTADNYSQTITAIILDLTVFDDNFEVWWANNTQARRVEGWWLEAGSAAIHMTPAPSGVSYRGTVKNPGWSAGDTVTVSLWDIDPT